MKKADITREGNPRHLKYFRGTDNMHLAGLIMMVSSGIIFFWNWYIWYFFALYILMFILFPTGLALFVIGSLGKSTDEEIERIATELSAAADVDSERDAALLRRQCTRPLPEIVSGYDYSDGLMFRKAKNNLIRSEIYKKATLLPLEDGLCIIYARVNIPCERVEKEVIELPYEEIGEIRMVSERRTIRFLKKSFLVLDSRIEIQPRNGTLLSLPAKESATLDTFIQELGDRKN